MPVSRRLAVVCIAGVVGLGCAEAPRAPSRAEEAATTRATMAEIAGTLREILPAAVEPERFADPSRRAALQDALDRLAASGERLESHAGTRDPGFGGLSVTFADDTREAARRFRAGQLSAARFRVGKLMEDCIACHSRLPSERHSELGASLLAEVRIDELDALERARLQFATRQFDAALATWENLFADGRVPVARLDLDGQLVDYLVVALRVEQDPARAERALAGIAARPDVPRYLAPRLEAWRRDLRELPARAVYGDPLARARELLAEADRRVAHASDRSTLVLDIAASALLHRFVDMRREGPEVAEAFYGLGVAESRIRRSWWLSEADVYLEAAIRHDPSGAYAAPAYALLEEQTLADWSGSAGLFLPPDVKARLEALEALIEEAELRRMPRR